MRRQRLSAALRIAMTPLIVWVLYLIRANVWFRLYPALMATLAFTVFAVSLRKTPLVEIIARRMGEELDAQGVAYCRRVTVIWTVFLAVHLSVTVATVFATHEIWAVYNGLVAYLLMGALFAGEWLYRRRFRRG